MRARVLVLVLSAALALAGAPAQAHWCPGNDPSSPDCQNTPPSQEWRDNYVPLFDAPNRNDGTQTEYQRWRDEWGCEPQFCIWADFSLSTRPYLPPDGDPSDPSPMEAHVGAAGDHSLLEAAHQTEEHDPPGCDPAVEGSCEGIHDAHGGTLYADICLRPNPGSGRSRHDPDSCDEGMKDTEVGLVIVDKNPCPIDPTGIPIPCFDEYHIVRPFDGEYTQRQMEATPGAVQRIVEDPHRYVCGYRGETTCP